MVCSVSGNLVRLASLSEGAPLSCTVGGIIRGVLTVMFIHESLPRVVPRRSMCMSAGISRVRGEGGPLAVGIGAGGAEKTWPEPREWTVIAGSSGSPVDAGG